MFPCKREGNCVAIGGRKESHDALPTAKNGERKVQAIHQGERCMKDAVQPIVHPAVHPSRAGTSGTRTSSTKSEAHLGAGKVPVWAGTTPVFVRRAAQKERWGRSSPHYPKTTKALCPRQENLRSAATGSYAKAVEVSLFSGPLFCNGQRLISIAVGKPGDSPITRFDSSLAVRLAPLLSSLRRNGFARSGLLRTNRRRTLEEGTKHPLQLLLPRVLQPVVRAISFGRRRCGKRGKKSRHGKNTKTGGSDPTFSAFSRPKSLWVAPARRRFMQSCLGRASRDACGDVIPKCRVCMMALSNRA